MKIAEEKRSHHRINVYSKRYLVVLCIYNTNIYKVPARSPASYSTHFRKKIFMNQSPQLYNIIWSNIAHRKISCFEKYQKNKYKK